MVEGKDTQDTGDNAVTPEKQAPPELRAEKVAMGICLFAAFFLTIMSSVWTDTSIGIVFIGYLPIILTVVLLIVEVEQGLKTFVYWSTPFLVALAFLIVMGLVNPLVGNQLNIMALAAINLILGLLVVLLLIFVEGRVLVQRAPEPEEFHPEKLEEFVHSIEDKCKALNFVIGRVYRTSNGGTDALRARLRIDKDWYNEFHSIQDKAMDEKKHEAIVLLHKIYDRLMLLAKKEKEVLTEAELRNMKNIARDKKGEDAIVDILVINDRDPVQHYFVGAVDGAKKLIDHLEGT